MLDPQNWPRTLRYGIALLAVMSAALLKLGLDPLLEVEQPFLFLFAAVMVSAWYGGFGPGLLATISAALISGDLFLTPAYSILDHSHGQYLRLGLFVVEGTVISWLGHRFRSAVARAERLRVEAATLAALAKTVSGSLDGDTVLQRITGAAREATTADRAHLSLRDPLSGTLMVRYQVGARGNEGRGVRIAPGHGLEGTVFASAEPLRTDNYAADLRLDNNDVVAAEGVVSALAVPIVLEGMVEGVLGVDNRTPRPFTDRDQRLLTSLADQAALALGNARLFSREQSSRAEAEKANRAKDDFLALLSHELRTPLAAVVGWVGVLRSGHIERERVERALESIFRNAQLLTILIDDLRDVSRIAAGTLHVEQRPLDLSRIVRDTIEIVRGAADAKTIGLTSALDPLSVFGDPTRLMQVVANLLNNAVEFTPAGGTVHVELARDGTDARLSVRDTGEGISPDALPHIFERFRPASPTAAPQRGGLGLGLALAKHLVGLHGGAIEAESAGVGKGARFTVRLPLPGEGDATGVARCLDGLRVLVVDDDRDAREVGGEARRPGS